MNRVLAYLREQADTSGVVYPDKEKIGELHNLSSTSVWRIFRSLIGKGYIEEIELRQGTKFGYQILKSATEVDYSKPEFHWTDEEIEATAEEFALLRTEDPFASTEVLEMLAKEKAKVQNVHPMSIKQKEIFFQLSRFKYRELFEDVKSEPVIIEAPVVEKQIDFDSILISMPLRDICSIAVRRLIDEMPNIGSAVSQIMSADKISKQMRQSTLPQKDSYPKILRIAILTLFSKQQVNGIRKKIPENVKLIFLDRQKTARADRYPKTADFIIVHRGSHQQQRSAELACGRERVHYIFGGIEAVVKKINELKAISETQSRILRTERI